MAVRTVELYTTATDAVERLVYFNTLTKLWYSDADCLLQISMVSPPTRSQYAFAGCRISNNDTSQLYIDADGQIVYTPSWTTSGTTTLYVRWTQISKRHSLEQTTSSKTYSWTPRTVQFFRSAAPDTHFYSDDRLTDEITSILPPYESGNSFAGCYLTDESGNITKVYVYADGTLNASGPLATSTTTTDWSLSSCVSMRTCYKMSLDANGGSGGPAAPVWWDRVRDRWCSDDTMLQPTTKLDSLPTKSGSVFLGYYTAASGGTQVVAADGTLGSYSALASSNKTVYAHWGTPVTVKAKHQNGTEEYTEFYYGGGRFFGSSALSDEITSVSVPTLANHRFLGYYQSTDGDTPQCVDADGNILSSFVPIGSTYLIYARYERVSYTITVSLNGGAGVSALYADSAKSAVYGDDLCEGEAMSSIAPLTKAGCRFLGLYSSDGADGTQLVTGEGAFTDAFAAFLASMGDTATVYAVWRQVFTVTLDAKGGAGAPGEIYYDDTYALFYDDAAMSSPVTSVATPAMECHAFCGFYDAEDGGTQRIGADGAMADGWAPSESLTLYARWEWKSYKYSLCPDGGLAVQVAIYNDGVSGAFYADDLLTAPATSVAVPFKTGHTFAGYYDGETCVVAADGGIAASSPLAADATATAAWTANAYVLSFDYNNGAGSVASKPVTFGEPVGELPTATRSRARFAGWMLDGVSLDPATAFSVAGNAVAVASWVLEFGGVKDWFGLGGGFLAATASNSGDNRRRQCVAHYGKFEKNVSTAGGVWRNPSVTYQVVRDGTVSVTLGLAYKGASGISGYMITSVEVQTRAAAFPTVTVRATANEGANAINTWRVSIPVKARARAQNLLYAVDGGGKMQSCRAVASCDPVVVAENGMPCASDVVNGRLTVDAELCAPSGESAPTATSGFASVGEPRNCGDKEYSAWSISVEKEL